MSAPKSPLPLQMRFLAIILGVTLLLWLPIEDTTEIWAILFAIAISIWLAIAFLTPKRVSLRSPLYNYILIGSLAGILITPVALLLMAFKTGLHGHETPDYTVQQLISILRRTPIWIAGGFLIGTGGGIWLTKRQPEQTA